MSIFAAITAGRRPWRQSLAGLLIFILAFHISACSQGKTVMPEANEKLNAHVIEAANTGVSLKLADVTDFEWDQVGFITEGTSAEDIKDAFAEPITKDKYYAASPALFVFFKDGTITKAIRILADAFFSLDAKKKYGRNTLLEPTNGPTGFLHWRE
jgi:hypothetical protein